MKKKRFPMQASLDFERMPHSNRRLFCDNILNRRLPESTAWSAGGGEEIAEKMRAAVSTGNAGKIIEALGFTAGKTASGKPAVISAGKSRAVFMLSGESSKTCACSLIDAMSKEGVDWGIITDGAVWRLYNRTVFSPLENYYETDLPYLLSNPGHGDFNYFRLFFTAEGFARSGRKPSFADGALLASRTAETLLVENLRDAVELAALDICRGFIRQEKETTGATPDGLGLDMIYRHSLLLLYRMLYILLAEAWGALPAGDAEYYKHSLTGFAAEAASPGALTEPGARATYSAWPILEKIFDRARRGDKALNAQPQCGELFCPERHQFLLRNKADDYHVQLALARIVHTEHDSDACFSDLHPARAAEIISRLPEMRLQIAKEPMVALQEKGRRSCQPAGNIKWKKIVEKINAGDAYIEHPAANAIERPRVSIAKIARSVEQCLEPVADSAFADADPAEALRNISIFDPVCGAGVSLMAAAEYLARRACSIGGLSFPQYKRIAVESAIFGADPNPLMAEAARVAISLYTANADLPPPVIEHRIAAGNALLGVRLREISEMTIPLVENLTGHIKTELGRIAAETAKADTISSFAYGDIRRKEGTIRRLAREQASLARAADLALEAKLAQKAEDSEISNRLSAMAAEPAKSTIKKPVTVARSCVDTACPLHLDWVFPALFGQQDGKEGFTAALITAPSTMQLEKKHRDFVAKRLGLKGRLVPADALTRAIAPAIADGGVISALSPASFARSKRCAELMNFIASNHKNAAYRALEK